MDCIPIGAKTSAHISREILREISTLFFYLLLRHRRRRAPCKRGNGYEGVKIGVAPESGARWSYCDARAERNTHKAFERDTVVLLVRRTLGPTQATLRERTWSKPSWSFSSLLPSASRPAFGWDTRRPLALRGNAKRTYQATCSFFSVAFGLRIWPNFHPELSLRVSPLQTLPHMLYTSWRGQNDLCGEFHHSKHYPTHALYIMAGPK